jgi:hypothetical protein
MYMRICGVNLSPETSSLNSLVRAYTFVGEREETTTGGGGVGEGGGRGVGVVTGFGGGT